MAAALRSRVVRLIKLCFSLPLLWRALVTTSGVGCRSRHPIGSRCFFGDIFGSNSQSKPADSATGPGFEPFELKQYEQMRDDVPRTSAYYQAIEDLVPGKVVLDIGTGALALLALHCVRAGARKVYAVEADAEAAEVARRSIEEAGFQDSVTLLVGKSEDIELPEKVDIAVHELFGEIVSREGVARILRGSRRWALKRCADAATQELPV
eukprot:TRINITY_DN38251_c0_g1_i2.p1 TRINITY_DN38251_c0_g1~~TRINITY_DN38251_c0_g1_i2.p1  ORF type:complete len:227 (-),score=17.98 TRINITY_DN38251_c0_g1_i2:405-1031(-)